MAQTPVPMHQTLPGDTAKAHVQDRLGWPQVRFLIGTLYVGDIKYTKKDGKPFRSVSVAFQDIQRQRCRVERMFWSNQLNEVDRFLPYHNTTVLVAVSGITPEPRVFEGKSGVTLTYEVEEIVPDPLAGRAASTVAPQQEPLVTHRPEPEPPGIDDLAEHLETERLMNLDDVTRQIPSAFERQAFYQYVQLPTDPTLWTEEHCELIPGALLAWKDDRARVWANRSVTPEEAKALREIRDAFPAENGNAFMVRVRDSIPALAGKAVKDMTASEADQFIEALRKVQSQALQALNATPSPTK